MEYCQNCDKNLPEDKFSLHLGYCRRNIKRCPECNIPYDINQQQQHREEYHAKQVCKYCHLQIKSSQIKAHQNKCSHKPLICQYCQLSVPKQHYNEHKDQCGARTEVCQKCFIPIKKKQYQEHYQNCFGPIENQQESASIKVPQYNQYNQYNQQSPSIYSSSSFSSSSSSYYSNYPNNTTTSYTTSRAPTTKISEPRVVSRRIISGPNAGKQLPLQQPKVQVKKQTIIDPKTGQKSIVTTTTTSYYKKANESPKKQTDSNSYNYNQTSSVTGYQNNYMSDYGDFGHFGGEDPELQAALMASLGYNQQNSAEMYSQIQQQHQIQKQIKRG